MEEQEEVDVGFAVKLGQDESYLLRSPYISSKFGGKPTWLDLNHIPRAGEVDCSICRKPMIFFMQVFAPDERFEHAQLRVIYVFCCKEGMCHMKGTAFKVFRCQLPLENRYYDKLGPGAFKNNVHLPKLCDLCGIRGTQICSACRKVSYCCKEHQLIHWSLEHKTSCKVQQELKENFFLFPEYGIEIHPEETHSSESSDDEATSTEEADDHERLVEYTKILKELNLTVDLEISNRSHSELEDDLLQTEENKQEAFLQSLQDATFSEFVRRTRSQPKQILRYARIWFDDEKKKVAFSPLYINNTNILREADVDPCAICGGPREFEFQILPQIIPYLELNELEATSSLDFGTILVFTCSNSCDIRPNLQTNESRYVEEFFWVQHIDFKLRNPV